MVSLLHLAEQQDALLQQRKRPSDSAVTQQTKRKARECKKCKKPMKGHPRSHCP